MNIRSASSFLFFIYFKSIFLLAKYISEIYVVKELPIHKGSLVCERGNYQNFN